MFSDSAPASLREADTCVPCRSVVMIGTDETTNGGISSVVRTYREGGLFSRYGIRYISTHREVGTIHKGWIAFRAWLSFLYEALTHAPLLHAHLSMRASFWRKSIFCLTAELTGRPYLIHAHGSEFMVFHDQESGPRTKRFIARTLRKAAVVVALSEQWRADLLRVSPGATIEVLPNAVALPKLLPRAQPAADATCNIVFLGRLGRRKGTYVLIDAFSRIVTDWPHLRLICGGDGDIEGTMRLAEQYGVADKVTCTGWLSPADAGKLLSTADIFTLPSHNEGLPMAVLEAMSWGLPVVSTPVGGIPQVITHGENGLLVPAGDAEALAGALDALVEDHQQRVRLGAAARVTIEQRYSLDAAIERMGRVYSRFGLKATAGGGS